MSNYLENKEKRKEIAKEIASVINRYSLENGSDTPDWVLAEYLLDTLTTYNTITKARERWYGRDQKPVPLDQCPADPIKTEPSLEQLCPNARIYRIIE